MSNLRTINDQKMMDEWESVWIARRDAHARLEALQDKMVRQIQVGLILVAVIVIIGILVPVMTVLLSARSG